MIHGIYIQFLSEVALHLNHCYPRVWQKFHVMLQILKCSHLWKWFAHHLTEAAIEIVGCMMNLHKAKGCNLLHLYYYNRPMVKSCTLHTSLDTWQVHQENCHSELRNCAVHLKIGRLNKIFMETEAWKSSANIDFWQKQLRKSHLPL